MRERCLAGMMEVMCANAHCLLPVPAALGAAVPVTCKIHRWRSLLSSCAASPDHQTRELAWLPTAGTGGCGDGSAQAGVVRGIYRHRRLSVRLPRSLAAESSSDPDGVLLDGGGGDGLPLSSIAGTSARWTRHHRAAGSIWSGVISRLAPSQQQEHNQLAFTALMMRLTILEVSRRHLLRDEDYCRAYRDLIADAAMVNKLLFVLKDYVVWKAPLMKMTSPHRGGFQQAAL